MSVQLTIVTPEGEAFASQVETVVLPGSEGDFGVLEGHERFLSALRIGSVSFQAGGTTRWAAVSQGFADVSGEAVVVLVDKCQLAEEIDTAVVEESRASAQASLGELATGPDTDVQRRELEDAVERASVWLEVAGKG